MDTTDAQAVAATMDRESVFWNGTEKPLIRGTFGRTARPHDTEKAKFDDLEALKAQMDADCAEARRVLSLR